MYYSSQVGLLYYKRLQWESESISLILLHSSGILLDKDLPSKCSFMVQKKKWYIVQFCAKHTYDVFGKVRKNKFVPQKEFVFFNKHVVFFRNMSKKTSSETFENRSKIIQKFSGKFFIRIFIRLPRNVLKTFLESQNLSKNSFLILRNF